MKKKKKCLHQVSEFFYGYVTFEITPWSRD